MKACALALVLCSLPVWGQNGGAQAGTPAAAPQKQAARREAAAGAEHKGAWDFGVWGGGGHTVSGGVQGVGAVNAGFRIGKILTAEHGGGWFRGNLEYALDLIPMYVFINAPKTITFLPLACPSTNPACNQVVGRGAIYGGGFNPFDLKWNFAGWRRISPYFELNGGVLFTNHELPVATSNVNFTSGATLGMNVFTRSHRAISLDLRYAHISNAGLASPNPGLNTVQVQIGYHWFK